MPRVELTRHLFQFFPDLVGRHSRDGASRAGLRVEVLTEPACVEQGLELVIAGVRVLQPRYSRGSGSSRP